MLLVGASSPDAFCVDRTEVTVGAYAACVDAGECVPADVGVLCNWKVQGRDDHPINCVEWSQADSYCNSSGKTLPTDAAWVRAAGGDDGRPFPWGAAMPAEQLCWSGASRRSTTCAVGSFPAGAAPSGALDLAGNVWEWTADRTLRGGAFDATDPTAVGVDMKSTVRPATRLAAFGFRCAAPAAP